MFAGYSGWVSGIRDWLDVDDYSDAQIASFMWLGQVRLNEDLNSTWMEEVVELTAGIDFAVGDPIDLTTDIQDFNRIRLVTPSWSYNPADAAPINEFKRLAIKYSDNCYDDESQNFYCIDAKKLYIFPLPRDGDVIEVRYYAKIPHLANGTQESNIFSEYHPNLLLYAASIEASPYMVEDERAPVWAQLYRSFLDNVNENSKREKFGSTPIKRQINSL